VVLFAACSEDQPPTAPVEPGDLAASHMPGHKVVNSLADPGNGTCNATQCTLREAINDPQSTEISFASGLGGTITLAAPAAGGGTLVIRKGLTVTGPPTGIVIRRRAADPGFRIVRIVSGVSVRLTNLTIRGGAPDGAGGGILNFGTLRLTDSRIIANSGGGIDNHGTLILTNSSVVQNSGTGIINRDDVTLTVARSTVADNGSGIFNGGGTVGLTQSTIARNAGRGLSQVRGTSTLSNARIVGNTGGGIFVFQSRLTLTNSTVAGNSAGSGGGIANEDGGSTTIISSTVAGNSADRFGGGIFNHIRVRVPAGVIVTNSTISGNSAGLGGGVFDEGSGTGFGPASVSLTNSTITRNTATDRGGGIELSTAASVGLRNSIVAQNTSPVGPDVRNPGEDDESFVSASSSLIGDGSGSGITNTNGNQVGSAGAPIDPRLGPLADNGGPTRTHALLLGSPAIDAASTPDCPTTDQRGVSRPQGAACDIGSYERAVQ
jgi:CSLREA domain-containing protein